MMNTKVQFTLSAADIEVARRLAAGDRSARDEAQSIYERHVREWVHGGRQCVAMCFLSEVFTPCPDLLLRARYRAQLIGQPFP